MFNHLLGIHLAPTWWSTGVNVPDKSYKLLFQEIFFYLIYHGLRSKDFHAFINGLAQRIKYLLYASLSFDRLKSF